MGFAEVQGVWVYRFKLMRLLHELRLRRLENG